MVEPSRSEISAGAVVATLTDDPPLYLLILDGHGNWGFPKGHLENGETPLEAAVRELEEETGVREAANHGPAGIWTWDFQDDGVTVHKRCHYFAFSKKTAAGAPEAAEGISQLAWLPYEAARDRLTFDTSRAALDAAREIMAGAPN